MQAWRIQQVPDWNARQEEKRRDMAVSNYGVASLSAYRARVDQVFLRLNCRELPIVARVVDSSRQKPIRMLLHLTNFLYDGWIYTLLLLFLLLREEWRLLLTAALSAAISFILYFMTKPRLARIRPCHLAVARAVQSRCLDRYSFPSGHCMTLIVMGVLLSWNHHGFIPILVGMLLLLCWARMAAAHHYPSDLIAGIGIGLIVAVPMAMILL